MKLLPVWKFSWRSNSSFKTKRPARPFGRNVMTTEPHSSDVVLFALAAGTLDETERVETATHVRECASCCAFVRAMEHVGGIVLDALPPTALADGSLTDVMATLHDWADLRARLLVFLQAWCAVASADARGA